MSVEPTLKGQPPAATAKAALKKRKTGSLSGRKILLEVSDTCKKAYHIKAAARDDKDEQYTAAVEWCHTHNKGARAFISAHPNNEKFSLVKKSALDERLKGTVRVTSKEQHADKRILTELEEAELAQWLKDMNLGRNGQDNDQIDAKVHEILQSRLFTNARGGRKCIKLSNAAQKVAKGQPLSPKWFTEFFARHQQLLESKVQQQVNSAMPPPLTLACTHPNLPPSAPETGRSQTSRCCLGRHLAGALR